MNDIIRTPLAIVGMACRLPGADSVDEYWQLVREGRCALGELPEDRLRRDLYYDPRKGVLAKSYSTIGGIVTPRPVDASDWRLPKSVIDTADVSHLELCAVAADALRQAGMDPRNLQARRAGVYIGHTRGGTPAGRMVYATQVEHTADYLNEVDGFEDLVGGESKQVIREIVEIVRRECPSRSLTGGPRCGAYEGARTVSEAFGLDGPYFSVDAACASSLMATMMGIQALQLGEIDMALVGGASRCEYDSLVLFSKAQSVSAKGSFPFDEHADGLVAAEGFVILVLKTLERAIADKDTIQAVIRGIGVSSDGRGKSLWAPRKEGQIEAVWRAYPSLDEIRRVQFIEAHATSTQVGDATEVAALASAVREHLPPGTRIPIGSVKANIGHTLEVAGIAGLLKTVLALRNRTIPPAIGVRSKNPKIDWEAAPFVLPSQAEPWPEQPDGGPRRGAVNAFGIGGLNTHVVIDEFDPSYEKTRTTTVRGTQIAGCADSPEPIAIIGAGAVFPGALTLDAFWQLLESGATALSEVPPDRWRMEIAYEPGSRKLYRSPQRYGGYIKDFEYDWRKHRIPPKQIAKADPLQFILLDAVEQALRDSGYVEKTFDRTRTGVIVGTSFGGEFSEQLQAGIHLPEFQHTLGEVLRRRGVAEDRIAQVAERYGEVLLEHMPALTDETGSFTPSTLASRITKTFDLMGGAASVDCDGASSIGALDICAQMLATRRCDMMICAAGQRALGLADYESYSLDGWLADGDPQPPYADSSSGIIPGEGAGVVILKRLSDAIRDGDQIHAVIRAIGSSKLSSLEESHGSAMRRCHEAAGIAPKDVGMIVSAASGLTDTDQAELNALGELLDAEGRDHPALLSTVVGQIGYCNGASGMASLLKAVLAMRHGELPEIRSRKHAANWVANRAKALRLTEATESLAGAEPLIAGVNSHDMRSLAYHVALEYPHRKEPSESAKKPAARARRSRDGRPWKIVRVAAYNRTALFQQVEALLEDPAGWLASGEVRFAPGDGARLAIVTNRPDDLAKKGKLAAQQHDNPGARSALVDRGVFFGTPPARKPRIAFMFPGQGSQYLGMFRTLIDDFEPAKAAMQEIDVSLSSLGYPTFAQMAWEDGDRLGRDIWYTQLAILAADSIMFSAVHAIGARPDTIAGHSFGELSGLWAAGAWSFMDAARATYARCQAIEHHVPSGGIMLSTVAPMEVLEDLCSRASGEIYVANYNSPTQVVLGGTEATVVQVSQQLEQLGHKTRRLAVPSPFHTPLMEGVKVPMREALGKIAIAPPATPVLSSVTNCYVADPNQIRQNLVGQLTKQIRYVDLVRRLADDGIRILVEVGPSQVLTRLHRQTLADRDVISIASDDRRPNGTQSLFQVQACLEVFGAIPTSERLCFSGSICSDTSLSLDESVEPSPDSVGNAGTAADETEPSDPYDAGLSHGRKYSRQIVATLRHYADVAGHNGDTFPGADADDVFTSDELDELRGIAEGANVALANIIAHNLRAFSAAVTSSPEPGLLRAPRAELIQALGGAPGIDATAEASRPSVISGADYAASLTESTDTANGICRRFAVRLLATPLQAGSTDPLSGAAIVYGSNDVSRAICNELERRGVRVFGIATTDETQKALDELDRCWNASAAKYLILSSPHDAATASTWRDQQVCEVMTPFLLCQRWHGLLKEAGLLRQGATVAVTNLGGDFGLSHHVPDVESGALVGLMKGLFVEESQPGKTDGFRSLAVDFDDRSGAAEMAKSVCDELERRTPEAEVGYVAGKRHVVRAIREDTPVSRVTADVEGGVCVVTGGARGVTAVVARELARRFGWRLHLVGTSPLREVKDEWRNLMPEQTKQLRATVMQEARARGDVPLAAWTAIEKAIEVDANLAAFAAAGVPAHYHACDIGDRSALTTVLDTIRKSDGPIAGIIHGAGFEKSCRFKSKKPELVERTLRAKVDGAAWLMELTRGDPLRFFVGFGSTSGRLGSHGQTDYCMANEMQAKLIDRFRAERPECRSAIFHWHAWDEVGMAVRPEVAGVLTAFGLKFMPTAEGIQFLASDLLAGLPDAEVLITEWSHYGRFCPQSLSDSILSPTSAQSGATSLNGIESARYPLMDGVESYRPGRQLVMETTLDPVAEPFLRQHTLREKPVLPLVIALEAFAEATTALTGRPVRDIRGIQVLSALRFLTNQPLPARIRATSDGEVIRCELLCDFVNRSGVRMKREKPYLTAEVRVGDRPARLTVPNPPEPPRWIRFQYPDNEHVIYHGPVFRCLKHIHGEVGGGVGRVVAPKSVKPLAGTRSTDGWLLAPEMLDACFYGAGVHLWFHHGGAVGIPESIDHLSIGRMPRPSEECRLQTSYEGESDDRGKFDLILFGDDGEVIYKVDGYHNVIIPGTGEQ